MGRVTFKVFCNIDDAFLVIEKDKSLAQAYASHIISVYNHYRWRQYVASTLAAGDEPWQALDDKPIWQRTRVLAPRQLGEWKFWLAT